MGMDQGAHNVLIPNPRDIPGFVKELGGYKYHVLPGLNTLFNALLANEDFQKLDFSELRLTLGGGMAVQKPVAERWEALTGCKISEGYGLSETSPVATANRFDNAGFNGSIGLPLPSTDIDIRDDEGKPVPLGEVGRDLHSRPAGDGWLLEPAGGNRQGDDRGRILPLRLTWASWTKRAIPASSTARRIWCWSPVSTSIPTKSRKSPLPAKAVLEAAAIGVPDDRSGEAVKLFVVKSDPALTEDDVKSWCADKLTNYKRPKYIEFRDELPKSNVGKILRRRTARREDKAKLGLSRRKPDRRSMVSAGPGCLPH